MSESLIRACGIPPVGMSTRLAHILLLAPLAMIVFNWSCFLIIVARVVKQKKGNFVTPKDGLFSALSFFLFLALYWIIYRIDHAINWQRPFDPAIACLSWGSAADGWYDDVVNMLGAPDPLFITNFAFGVVLIYVLVRIMGKTPPWLFGIIFGAIMAVDVVADFVMRRILVGQFFTNLLVGAALAAGLCPLSHLYLRVFDYLPSRASLSLRDATTTPVSRPLPLIFPRPASTVPQRSLYYRHSRTSGSTAFLAAPSQYALTYYQV